MESGDLTLPDGRMLRWYDAGGDGTPVVWHHGTGNTGEPPEPLVVGSQLLNPHQIPFRPFSQKVGVQWWEPLTQIGRCSN